MQIGDENVHRIRSLMDEVFGSENFCGTITFAKNSGATDDLLPSPSDYLIWFAKIKAQTKFRRPFWSKIAGSRFGERYGKVREADGRRRNLTKEELADPLLLPAGSESYTEQPPISAGFRENTSVPFTVHGITYDIGKQRNWKTHIVGMERLVKADRLIALPKMAYYERRISDFPVVGMTNVWDDTQDRLSKNYVVETVPKVIERCVLMTTDPGDLVLDPTCGSGTTAYIAEQWGRVHKTRSHPGVEGSDERGLAHVAEQKKRTHSTEWKRLEKAAAVLKKARNEDYVKLSIAAKTYFMLGQKKGNATKAELATLASKFGWSVTKEQVDEAAQYLKSIGLVNSVPKN